MLINQFFLAYMIKIEFLIYFPNILKQILTNMNDSEYNRDTCMNTIKEYMTGSTNAPTKEERIDFMIQLFQYFLTVPQFIATEAKFRLTVLSKIDELFNEIKILSPKNGHKLIKLLKKVKIFVNNLKSRPDYILLQSDYKIIITL